MISNKLSVNQNKAEYLMLYPNNVNIPVKIINIGFNTTSPSDSTKKPWCNFWDCYVHE